MQSMLLTKLVIASAVLLFAGVLDGGLLKPLALSGPPAETEQARTDRYGDPLPPGAIARFGTVRLRHAGAVRQVVFSPDGRTLASASNDGTARLWDAATGKELYRLTGQKSSVSSVAFSPDGKLLASGTHGNHGSPSHPVFLWDTATGKQLRRLVGHKNEVTAVTFSPDGKTLASSGYGKSIRLWDVASGKERRRLEVAEPYIFTLAFSPDGQLLASGGGDKIVHLWDVANGVEVRRLLGCRGVISSVAFSPDGKTLAAGGSDGTIRLYAASTGTELRLIQAGQLRVASLAFVQGGQALISGGFQGAIQLWDAATGAKIPSLCDDREGQCAISTDGKRLAQWNGSAIRLWDMTTAKEILPREGHWSSVRAAAFSGDGDTLISAEVSAEPGYGIRVWETATGRQRSRITGSLEKGRRMAFSPDGTALAATGEHSRDSTVRLWDVRTGKRLHTLTHAVAQAEGVTALAYAPDGRILATASGDAFGDEKASCLIYLWDAVAGREVRRLAAHKSTINALGFSPDSRLLASASWDRTLCVWDTATGKEIRCLKGHEDGVRTVVFSPDGRLLASAGQEGTIRLWEVATGGQVRRLKSWATVLAFSPDGKTLASVNGLMWNNVKPDNALRLWDVLTGDPIGNLPGHPDGVTLMRFSPAGKVLVSGGDDSTLLAWDMSAYRKERPKRRADLGPEELEVCWRNLAHQDAAVAYGAIAKLATAPGQATSLLGERLRSESPEVPLRIATLISRLDDERFRMREEATAELGKFGDEAELGLRKALAGKPSLEVHRRVEQLLERLEGAIPTPDRLRGWRALEVLEHIGTPDAQRVLNTLAKGAPSARLTQEAKASLERLAKRRTAKP